MRKRKKQIINTQLFQLRRKRRIGKHIGSTFGSFMHEEGLE